MFVVAIDGPAGSGKGSVCKKVADLTGLVNIDTGVTYRAVTLATIRENYKIEEKEKICNLLNNIKIEFKKIDEKEKYFLNGEDVTEQIRTKEVNEMVSPIAAIKEVRIRMVELQRQLAEGKDIIMEGRDIGTYVFPDANIKIYLDAKVEERAKRRYEEVYNKNNNITYEEILKSLKLRDYNDMYNKEIGALKIADDAIVIDTTKLSIEEVVEKINNIIITNDEYIEIIANKTKKYLK